MSRGVNKVILIGSLGNDPDIKGDGGIANLSIATNETWKDKQTGEKREKTEWHRCVVYGKLAEIVGQYTKKGSKVYVEGRLQTRKWQGQDGQDNYTTEIVINDLQMLDSRNQGDNQSGVAPMQGGFQGQQQNQAPAPQQGGFQGQQQNQAPAPQQGGFQGQQQNQAPAPQQGGFQGQQQNQVPAPQQGGFQGQQQGGFQNQQQGQAPAPQSQPDFDDDIPF